MPVHWIETPFTEPLKERIAVRCSAAFALYWLGQAGFLLQAGSVRLIIDPYLSDSLATKYRGKRFSHERMMPPPVSPQGLGIVDLVLCTHPHTDHMDPETLAPLAASTPDLRFVVPEAARDEACRRIGVGEDRLWLHDAGRVLRPLPKIAVWAVRAAHEDLATDDWGRFRTLGYVIESRGIRVFHSGDTVPYPGMAEEVAALRPDVALLPVNGRSEELRSGGIAGNLTLDEAVQLCDEARIPVMIAHHYGMFAFNTASPETIDRKAAEPGVPVRVIRARTHIEYTVSFP